MAADSQSPLKRSGQLELFVDQALHGYSGGHRLLESSVRLSATAERQIDVLSDLSGSSPPDGFEEYLTIYPVTGSKKVAFAKTWLAKEMSRPGCVWTHTLLLDFSLVQDLPRLDFLTRHFVRPDRKVGFDGYGNVLRPNIGDLSRTPESARSIHPINTGVLVRFWYSNDAGKKPLIIPANSSRTYEDTLVSFWEQQLPAFRTSVSISTGSISDRKLAGVSFDVQVVPRQNTREVLRQCRGVNLEDIGHPTWDEPGVRSVIGENILAGDITCPSLPLRSFLRGLTDSGIGLADIPYLAEAFSAWSGPTEPSEKVDMLWKLVASASPEKDQAPIVKAVFFGNSTGMLKGEVERSMLRQLLLANRPIDFLDIETLQIPARCSSLACSDVASAVSLLEDVSRSSRPSKALIDSFNSLVDSLPPGVLLAFLARNGPLLNNIVSRRPELVLEPEFWEKFANSRHEAIAAIAKAPDFVPSIAEAVVDILVRTEGTYLAEVFIDRCTDSNLAAFLHSALGSRKVPVELFECLLQRKMEAVFAACSPQLILPVAFLVAASRVVYPGWSGNSRFPFGAWSVSLLDLEALRRGEQVRVCAFSVAMALAWKVPESADILSSSFPIPYLEIKADRLDYQSWALLEPHVPSLWGWSNWDKCERLRRAILERVAQGIWPPSIVAQIAGDAETMIAFIKTASDRGFHRIFPALLQSLEANPSRWSDQERLAVRRELVGHARPDQKIQDLNRDFVD